MGKSLQVFAKAGAESASISKGRQNSFVVGFMVIPFGLVNIFGNVHDLAYDFHIIKFI